MMKKQTVGLNISGIKCDNLSCSYIDESVQMEDYDKWVNKPCPKCGANLLTEADYELVQKVVQATNIVNGCIPEGTKYSENPVVIEFEMNGSGSLLRKRNESKREE